MKFDETVLLNVLRAEELDSATYFDSELAREQATAQDRYFARPYGDGSEVPNRSQVVTRDIQDAINWTLPHLMRHFTGNDDLISCNDDGLDDGAQELKDAADYLRHVFFKDNDGERNIHDLLYDGFLSKYGVMRVHWEPAEPQAPQTLEGLTVEQLGRYIQDPRYQILEASIDGEIEPEPQKLEAQPMPQPQQPSMMPQGPAE